MSTSKAAFDMMAKNIEVMNPEKGFEVVIICCSSAQQARYWQKRLEGGRGSVLPPTTLVLAVQEDWPGGAGNALGTLYAYYNAVALATERYGIDINAKLASGEISVGLYHTAGKGTRLAPLPGAENNNKPGVKLPATIKVGGVLVPMTILEAVIRQTGCYAISRPGRLSVFWGDQVFIPTVPVEYKVTHHVDILCELGPMPSEAEWKERSMHSYGLIAVNKDSRAAQVEKVDHATAVSLLSNLGEIKSVGPSLGSFSVSAAILFCLLEEFQAEINFKKGKLDSDPHLWMPMTLDKPAYLQLMAQKGISADTAGPHYDRIQGMMTRFLAVPTNKSLGVFGPVDVGQGFYWWDYGQLLFYQRNTSLVTLSTPESDLMRKFFGISHRVRDSAIIKTSIDGSSVVSSSHIGNTTKTNNGSIKNSVLSNVRCNYIDAEDCILVNVTADSIIARPGSIVYNIVDDTDFGLELSEGQVLAGVFNDEGSQIVIRSSTTIDGGKAWEQKLEWNPKTFQDVYNMNAEADPLNLEKKISSAHSQLWRHLSMQPNFNLSMSPRPQSRPQEQLSVQNSLTDLATAEKKAVENYWYGFSNGVVIMFAAIGVALSVKFLVSQK